MPWPLTVGKHWTLSGAAGGVSISVDASVDAYESVTVPADVFPAFRIETHACGARPPKSGCGDFRMWVSATVKNAVEIAWDDEPGWDPAHLRRGAAVLTSYTVTPP